MSTEIVEIPALLEIKPFPALGSANYNQEAYDNGVSVPPAIERAREIVAAGRTNALAAQALATSAGESAQAAREDRLGTEAARDRVEEAGAIVGRWDQLVLGPKAFFPTTDNAGQPLRVGAEFFHSVLGERYSWSGLEWKLGMQVTAGVSSINNQQGAVELPKVLAYDQRADLRSNETSGHALVDGLGWFRWVAGSDEPDDDESCFATQSGRWLLQAAHWDVVDAWQLPDAEWAQERLSKMCRVLQTTAQCPISGLSSYSQASFDVLLVGADIGDAVLACPQYVIDPRATFFARIEGPGVVRIYLSAPVQSTTISLQGLWSIFVFKEV